MATINFSTNWDTGSYLSDLLSISKIFENAGLAAGISSQSDIRPELDGGGSIAIGYGFDLLVNSNETINNYLSSVGLP